MSSSSGAPPPALPKRPAPGNSAPPPAGGEPPGGAGGAAQARPTRNIPPPTKPETETLPSFAFTAPPGRVPPARAPPPQHPSRHPSTHQPPPFPEPLRPRAGAGQPPPPPPPRQGGPPGPAPPPSRGGGAVPNPSDQGAARQGRGPEPLPQQPGPAPSGPVPIPAQALRNQHKADGTPAGTENAPGQPVPRGAPEGGANPPPQAGGGAFRRRPVQNPAHARGPQHHENATSGKPRSPPLPPKQNKTPRDPSERKPTPDLTNPTNPANPPDPLMAGPAEARTRPGQPGPRSPPRPPPPGAPPRPGNQPPPPNAFANRPPMRAPPPATQHRPAAPPPPAPLRAPGPPPAKQAAPPPPTASPPPTDRYDKGGSDPESGESASTRLLRALDEIPRAHTMLTTVFTWLLLAGFVIMPGSFTSAAAEAEAEAEAGEAGEAAAATVELPVTGRDGRRVVLTPANTAALVVGFLCAVAGAFGAAWLALRWRRVYIWVLNKLYQPLVLYALAGELATLAAVYTQQGGEWSPQAVVAAVVEAVVFGVSLVLFLLNNHWLLGVMWSGKAYKVGGREKAEKKKKTGRFRRLFAVGSRRGRGKARRAATFR